MATGLLSPSLFKAKSRPPEEEHPECGKCGLIDQCIRPMLPAAGRGRIPVLFVGEFPTQEEDETGRLFHTEAGKFLRSVVDKHSDFIDCKRTHALRCALPKKGKGEVPEKHINACRPLLFKEIVEFKPRVVILMGHAAVKAFIPGVRDENDKVGILERWVGWQIPSTRYGAWICPTYDPGFVLRKGSNALTLLFEEHIRAALALVERPVRAPDLGALRSEIELVRCSKTALRRLRRLERAKGVLAFDYEANTIKPDDPRARIYAASFCLNGKDTFTFMVEDCHHAALSKVLLNPRTKKVAANLKNEERWTIAKLGHPVRNWWWDTMQAAHVLNNTPGITSLKFQSFVRWGVTDYEGIAHEYLTKPNPKMPGFNMIHECPVEDLLVYNGLDSLLEYMLALEQRREMFRG